MRLAFLVLVAATGATWGCGPAGRAEQPSPRERYGSYTYYERVSGGRQTVLLEGEITITPDTIMVEGRPGPCRYEPSRSTPVGIVYTCGPSTISFDRSDPLGRAHYSTVVTVTEVRSVCVRYTTNALGAAVCAESRNELTERESTRTGLLRPRRVP